jgi:hypothetical protein
MNAEKPKQSLTNQRAAFSIKCSAQSSAANWLMQLGTIRFMQHRPHHLPTAARRSSSFSSSSTTASEGAVPAPWVASFFELELFSKQSIMQIF